MVVPWAAGVRASSPEQALTQINLISAAKVCIFRAVTGLVALSAFNKKLYLSSEFKFLWY